MKLRPFMADDFDVIKQWDNDERVHNLWCAGRMDYPLERENFQSFLADIAKRHGDTPFTATTDSGEVIGFFCYSLNTLTNEGMLKFVIIDPEHRGMGYGREMLKLAVKYAFEITKAEAVHLNVFTVNAGAKKCYESVGFTERETVPDAFPYKDEAWGRCNMIIRR